MSSYDLYFSSIINFYHLIYSSYITLSITVIVNYSFLRACYYFITLICNASSLGRYRRARCSRHLIAVAISLRVTDSIVIVESSPRDSCNENSSFITTLRVPLLLNEIFLLCFTRRLARTVKDQTMLRSLCSRHRLVY